MALGWDEAKRELTLRERGLDFADADQVFAGSTTTLPDERHDCGEPRWRPYGLLAGRLVMLVWTERDGARHVLAHFPAGGPGWQTRMNEALRKAAGL